MCSFKTCQQIEMKHLEATKAALTRGDISHLHNKHERTWGHISVRQPPRLGGCRVYLETRWPGYLKSPLEDKMLEKQKGANELPASTNSRRREKTWTRISLWPSSVRAHWSSLYVQQTGSWTVNIKTCRATQVSTNQDDAFLYVQQGRDVHNISTQTWVMGGGIYRAGESQNRIDPWAFILSGVVSSSLTCLMFVMKTIFCQQNPLKITPKCSRLMGTLKNIPAVFRLQNYLQVWTCILGGSSVKKLKFSQIIRRRIFHLTRVFIFTSYLGLNQISRHRSIFDLKYKYNSVKVLPYK